MKAGEKGCPVQGHPLYLAGSVLKPLGQLLWLRIVTGKLRFSAEISKDPAEYQVSPQFKGAVIKEFHIFHIDWRPTGRQPA